MRTSNFAGDIGEHHETLKSISLVATGQRCGLPLPTTSLSLDLGR